MEDAEVAVGRRADPDAEDQPAATQPVQARRLPGQLPRPPPRYRRDHGAELDPRGAGGDHGQDEPGIDDRRPVAAVREHDVVPQEEPVETRFLGGDAKLDQPGGLLAEIGHRDGAQQAVGHRQASWPTAP
jgi:hypothetical protein